MAFDEWARIQKFYRPGNKIFFHLLRDLMYRDTAGKVHVVPAGFVSDLGSIPRFLWPVLPPHEYPSAYILHDYYCEDKSTPRKYGDDLLLEALHDSHAPTCKRYIVYSGVRTYAIIHRLK